MNRSWETPFWLALLLGVLPVATPALHAQEAAVPPSAPHLKSPVDTFRELLAMTLEERKKAIADRSPEDQKLILAKIREYESLKPDQRELRLRVTELNWFLLPLLNSSATNRAFQLALIPKDMRKLVEDRLQQWDLLKPGVRQELSANEQAMQWFLRPEERASILATISPARQWQLQADVRRIRAMPEAQRRELSDYFNKFFELTAEEQRKTLSTLSDAERRQMEKSLRVFETMPESQRRQCVQAFKKFANMSLAEQQQFLKNADRWRWMSPDERQKWREVVNAVPELPPLPAEFSVPVATNGR